MIFALVMGGEGGHSVLLLICSSGKGTDTEGEPPNQAAVWLED